MYLTRRRKGETGAMMVQMAVASIAFIGLASLAVDWGIKLIARTEIQRAADAGALAGAVSLAFDPTAAANGYTVARANARAYALANTVFGEAPDVHITNDINFIECPEPGGGPGTLCVQVDAYRNQTHGNALPTFFARVVGVNEQGVKATATAKVLNGDTTDCLRPWAVIDRWDEYAGTEPDYPAADPDFCSGSCGGPPPSTYDKYSTGRGRSPMPEPDLYVPPSGSSPGTGYRVPDDIGKQFGLKVQPSTTVSSGWGLALEIFPRSDSNNTGVNAYKDNILTCSGIDVTIADPAVACPADPNDVGTWAEKVEWAGKGCVRVQPGIGGPGMPTAANVEALVARDADAKWGTTDDGTPGVVDSAFSVSPRIVPVAIVDIDNFLSFDPTGGHGVVRIVNIFGFFIEGMGTVDPDTGAISLSGGPGPNQAVIGRLMKFAGSGSGKVTLDDKATYSKIIVLAR